MIKNDSMHSGIFEIADYGDLPHFLKSKNERGVLFMCITSGALTVSSEENIKNLSAGECFVASLSRGYKFSFTDDKPCNASYVSADGSLVYDLMRFYGISDFMSAIAPSALEALEEIQRRRLHGADLDAVGDTATALHRFLFKFKRAYDLGSSRPGGTALEIKNYIDAHLEGKLTLDELSKAFFVSKTQIFRIFKEAYGTAPMQYFLKNKIELSKKMLGDGTMKISDIAEALSFTDAKHFTKTFKRFTKELPRSYRKRSLQNSK